MMNIDSWTLSAWVIAFALSFVIVREHRRSSPDFARIYMPPTRLEILVALVFIVVGLILRFAFFSDFFEGRLTGDEQLAPFIYVSTVVNGEESRNGATHLTLALAMDVWYKIFGLTPLAARTLSATLATVSLICFFLGLRRAAGMRLALWSTAFLSVSLYGVYFSKLAFEIGWALFVPPIVFYLLISAYQKRSTLWAAFAGLMFSLGLFSYPGVLLASIAVVTGMALSFIIYQRKIAPLKWRNAHWWKLILAFAVGSIPFTAFAILQHFTVLAGSGAERQGLLMGGGGLSLSINGILSTWSMLLHDALIQAASWYLPYRGMAFFETASLPLGIYGLFMFWRAGTRADKAKRWVWYGLFLTIPICIAIIPFTGAYPGMRRALFVLLPYSVALGGGLIFLLSAITAQRSALAMPGPRLKHSYQMLSLGVLLLAATHPIAYQFTTGRDVTRMSLGEGYSRPRIPFSFILSTLKTHDIVLSQEEFNSGWFDGLIYQHLPQLYKRYNPEADIPHKVLLLPYIELTKLSGKILMTWDAHKFDQLVAAGKVTLPADPAPFDGALDGVKPPYWGILTSAAYTHVTDTAYNLTDNNWVNGVAVRWAGFFIYNSPGEQDKFKPGEKIKFSDGSIRTITKANPSGTFLEIFLDGSPLDGAVVGSPNAFQILKHSDALPSSATYNLTDGNWVNGVARSWTGFFVANTSENIAEFIPGKTITFADGSEREIVKQAQSGDYLNIDLSGSPLDGTKVGYPKKFKVQK